MSQVSKLLTCTKAAKILGFTADYVRRLCIDGKIKAEKLGNDWVFPASAIKDIKRQRHHKELEHGSN